MSGAYLTAALLTERVVREIDGVATLVRIVDTVTIEVEVPPGQEIDFANALVELPLPLSLYLRVVQGSDSPQGPHDLEIRGIRPNGEAKSLYTGKIELTEAAGAEFAIALKLQLSRGTYWFVVIIDGEEVTRSPLTVNVSPAQPKSDPSET